MRRSDSYSDPYLLSKQELVTRMSDPDCVDIFYSEYYDRQQVMSWLKMEVVEAIKLRNVDYLLAEHDIELIWGVDPDILELLKDFFNSIDFPN